MLFCKQRVKTERQANVTMLGDLRAAPLKRRRQIRHQNNGCAVKRLKWPGEAAVTVSVVHVCKGQLPAPYWLSGRDVARVTAYLFHTGGDESPSTLPESTGQTFIGCYVLGMGFSFDDTDEAGISSRLAEMHRLGNRNPRNLERIFPYLGNDEVVDRPDHAHHRYVIDFADFPLRRDKLDAPWETASEERRKGWRREGAVPSDYPGPVAADWPDLLQLSKSA